MIPRKRRRKFFIWFLCLRFSDWQRRSWSLYLFGFITFQGILFSFRSDKKGRVFHWNIMKSTHTNFVWFIFINQFIAEPLRILQENSIFFTSLNNFCAKIYEVQGKTSSIECWKEDHSWRVWMGLLFLFVWFFLKLMNYFAHFEYFWCFLVLLQ